MYLRPLILFSCTISLVCAQEILSLDKIEVQETYSVLEERKENSIAKRIIKAEELNQYGDLNALELLKRTPGVTIADGKKKGAPGKGYTQVLVDGEAVSTSSKRRGSPLEQISPDMIERIEVMSNGSAEHSAEAMGGIVNIILKKPASDGKTIAKVTGGLYKDVPMATIFGQYEKKEGTLSYLLNATYTDTQKADTADKINDSISGVSKQNNTTTSRSKGIGVNTKILFSPTQKSKYTLDGTVGYFDESADETMVTQSTSMNKTIENAEADGGYYWAKVGGEHHLGQSVMFDWKLVTHQNTQNGTKNSYDYGSYDDLNQEDDSVFRIYGGNSNLSYSIGQHFLKTGIEYRHMIQRDEVQTIHNGVDTTLSSDNVTMDQDKYAVYLQDEWSISENMIFTPGVRYEKIERDLGAVSTLDYVAPSLHFLYRLSPEDNLRASIAKTVKLPRLDEISTSVNSSLDDNDINNPDITGNVNLTEESALSYELRLEHYFEDKGIISLTTFYRDIDDKIEKLTTYNTLTSRYVEKPYNAGEGELWGTELEIKKSLSSLINGLGVWGNLSVQNSTLQNSQNSFRGVIGETPDYLFNLGLDHSYTPYRLTYGLAYRYNGGFDDPIDQSGIEKSQEGYGVLDMYITKRLDSMFKVSMNLKNITTSTIETTSRQYNNGILTLTQVDRENSEPQFLFTLEGKW